MIGRRRLIGGGVTLAAMAGRALAAPDRAPVVNRIMLTEGRVWMAAKINGNGPFLFIVDTGATLSFIEDAFAKAQRLERVEHSGHMVGYGGKGADYSWYSAREGMLANGIRFRNMLFTGVGKRASPDAVGSFGVGLFISYDSDFDFMKGEWRAYLDGRPNFDGLTRLPSRLSKENDVPRIEVDASIDGFEGDFIVDTGAPGMTMNGRAAAKSGLWASDRPYAVSTARGLGDGGHIRTRIYRAERIKVGPFVFQDLLVTVDKPGTLSEGRNDGLLGLSILSQLHLTTDVSAGLLYATPNGAQRLRQGYPLGALGLEREDGRIVVDDIGAGSPAAKAGIRRGDIIVGGDIGAILRAADGAPGKQVSLKIERGGVQQDISYTLAPWF